MVYYEQEPSPDDAGKPPGCLDTLVIIRVVFGVILWPLAAMFAVVVLAAFAFFLFTVWVPLGLIPILIAIGAIFVYARWEQHHYRPPDV